MKIELNEEELNIVKLTLLDKTMDHVSEYLKWEEEGSQPQIDAAEIQAKEVKSVLDNILEQQNENRNS